MINEINRLVAEKLLSEGVEKTFAYRYVESPITGHRSWQPHEFTTDPAAAWRLLEYCLEAVEYDDWEFIRIALLTSDNPKLALCEEYLEAEVEG